MAVTLQIDFTTNCDRENAVHKAERLRKQIEACRPEGLLVTASIGVAQLEEEETLDSLFERADKAVYGAKESGRNRVVAG